MKWFKRGMWLVIIATLGWFLLGMPSSPEQKRTKSGPVLRIATANVYVGNDQPLWLGRRMGVFDADVLLIIEATAQNLDTRELERSRTQASRERHNRKQKAKDEAYTPDPKPPKPYNKVMLREGVDGLALYTRPALRAQAQLVESLTQGPCHWPLATARFTWRGEWYSLLGIHAPPPVGGCEGNAAYLAAVAKTIRSGRMARDLGAARAGDIAIVLGDLNTMPMASNIEPLFAAGLQDAYDEASVRPGPTWGFNFGPDFARIDYIFVAQSEKVWNGWTLNLPGSDHRAVMVDIKSRNTDYVEPEEEPDHRLHDKHGEH